MKIMLPLLLPLDERTHLLRLAQKNTQNYEGNEGLQQALRHLRSVGLLQMKDNHRIAEIPKKGMLNLAEYVELTREGWQWVERIRELEKGQTPSED